MKQQFNFTTAELEKIVAELCDLTHPHYYLYRLELSHYALNQYGHHCDITTALHQHTAYLQEFRHALRPALQQFITYFLLQPESQHRIATTTPKHRFRFFSLLIARPFARQYKPISSTVASFLANLIKIKHL